MYSPYGIAIVTFIAVCLVVINVSLHYEVLNFLSRTLGKLTKLGRTRVPLIICTLLMVHIVEIWIFAGGILLADWYGGLGNLQGEHIHEWLDYVYFSSMTYTTVGYGDVLPNGPIRFIAAMEALLGLMLITWSASFTYLEMERFWRDR